VRFGRGDWGPHIEQVWSPGLAAWHVLFFFHDLLLLQTPPTAMSVGDLDDCPKTETRKIKFLSSPSSCGHLRVAICWSLIRREIQVLWPRSHRESSSRSSHEKQCPRQEQAPPDGQPLPRQPARRKQIAGDCGERMLDAESQPRMAVTLNCGVTITRGSRPETRSLVPTLMVIRWCIHTLTAGRPANSGASMEHRARRVRTSWPHHGHGRTHTASQRRCFS